MPIHEAVLKPGWPSSATVGVSGSSGWRLAPVCTSARALPALTRRRERQHRADHHRHVAADQVLHRGRAALVGHVLQLDAVDLLDQLHGEMRDAGARAAGIDQLVLLRRRPSARRASSTAASMHRQRVRDRPDQHHGLERGHGVEGQRIERRIHPVGIVGEQDGAAVAGLLRHIAGADRAEAPGRASTMTFCPNCSRRRSLRRRAEISVGPPGGNGTTILTALSGQNGSTARAAVPDAATTSAIQHALAARSA